MNQDLLNLPRILTARSYSLRQGICIQRPCKYLILDYMALFDSNKIITNAQRELKKSQIPIGFKFYPESLRVFCSFQLKLRTWTVQSI